MNNVASIDKSFSSLPCPCCLATHCADFTIYVIDTAGGDKIPRKGGPGITQSDVLVVNKTDLAEAVGSSLDIMKRDAAIMRGQGPVVFAQVKHGPGVDDIVLEVEKAFENSRKNIHNANINITTK